MSPLTVNAFFFVKDLSHSLHSWIIGVTFSWIFLWFFKFWFLWVTKGHMSHFLFLSTCLSLMLLLRLGQLSEDRRKLGCSMILKMRKVLDWSELVLLSVINSIYFYWTCHLTLDKVTYANLASYRFCSLYFYRISAEQWDFESGNSEVPVHQVSSFKV